MATQDILRDFVLFNGADKQVGRIDGFKPPTLNLKVEDFRGAGMDAPLPLDMGMEKLEASWTTSGIDRKTYAGFGLISALRTTVSVRGAVIDPLTALPKPVIHLMTGLVTVVDPSEWKPGERATLQTTMALTFYQLSHTIPGVPLIAIDVINGVRIIDGVDQLALMRAIVGR